MKVLALGSGQMRKSLVYDLAKQDSAEQIVLVDIDTKSAEALAKEVGVQEHLTQACALPIFVDRVDEG